MLSRFFSQTTNYILINLIAHKQLSPQIDFVILQNNTLNTVHHLLKHEEVLPHQKDDSHLILSEYGIDQFSISINDKGKDMNSQPLSSLNVSPHETIFHTRP